MHKKASGSSAPLGLVLAESNLLPPPHDPVAIAASQGTHHLPDKRAYLWCRDSTEDFGSGTAQDGWMTDVFNGRACFEIAILG